MNLKYRKTNIWFFENMIKIVKLPNNINQEIMYYLLKSDTWKWMPLLDFHRLKRI